ncbi:MAG: SpoIIE family protein phosphatase [Streptosporangiaceae bacterium]
MSAGTSVPRPGQAAMAEASDQALLAALLARAPMGFAFIDQDLRIRRASESLGDLIGVPAAAQVGLSPAQAWPAALAGPAEWQVRRLLAGTRIPAARDASYGGGDGEPRPAGLDGPDEPDQTVAAGSGGRRLVLSWYPARAADGTVAGITMIVADASASPEAAERLRRATERYRSLVQAGNQVVWMTDPAGKVAEDAPEWRWITGQSAAEYLSEGWLGAVHPDDRDRIEQDWLDCVRTGAVFDGSYRVRTKTGSYRHYDVRAVPIERDGVIIEWMGASTDVTGQREADEMRGRLTEQLSAAALRTSRLQQATALLAKELSVPGVAAVIAEIGQSAVRADRTVVAMVDADRLRLRIIGADDEGTAEGGGAIPLTAASVLTAAIAARRPLIIDGTDDLRQQVGADQAGSALVAADERAWVGLPLMSSAGPLGALQFSFARPRKITDEDKVFLEALAGQCALALERAVLYEREHATAETLQRSLLPDILPVVPGIELTALYKPMTIEVGGDWYDAFRLSDGKLAIATGDVMGKGLIAAAGMGRVRNALRALALTDPRPEAVLAGLDRLFQATEEQEQVTTVCYLVVDPATGQGVAGNAGHLPPLLIGPDGPPRLDEAEAGTPLGWASPRRQYPFSLGPGNIAVLYSDGLVENRKRGLDVGLDELVSVAGQAPPEIVADSGMLIGYLVDRMLAGYEQDDDVTVLALRMPEAGRTDDSAGSG